MNKHFGVGLLAFACCTTAFGGALDGRHLAILDTSLNYPNGTLHAIQIMATADKKECESSLAGMISGQDKGAKSHNASVTRHKQECVTELPPELLEVGQGLPLSGAYYLTKSLQTKTGKIISIDIFLGVDESNPKEMCKRLAAGYATQFPDVKCIPPLVSKSR